MVDRKLGTSGMARYFLIQDPFHEYAVHFIERIVRDFGYRPLCFYTDPKRRFYLQPSYPILGSSVIAESFEVNPGALEEFAGRIRGQYDVAGVIPFSEETLGLSLELADLLGVGLTSLETARRFRDKFLLKEYLRGQSLGLRVNRLRCVGSVADVFDPEKAQFPHFVLKPRQGFGNRGVGFFDAKRDRQKVEGFFRQHRDEELVMEELVRGREYFVNGQVSAGGRVDVVAAFEYERVAANGRENIDFLTRQLHQRSLRFAELSEYVARVVRAAGLRRSPFHVEVKVDDDGPCLIELNARLAGNRNAWVCNYLHGDRIDVFDMAAHDYLTAEESRPPAFDWDHYNRVHVLYVNGIAERSELVFELEGVREVEKLPQFHSWVRKPELGAWVTQTTDVMTAPYAVLLSGEGPMENLVEASREVRRLLVWNQALRPLSRTFFSARSLWGRARQKVSWLAHRVRRRARSASQA